MVSSTQQAAAAPTGLPPKVVPWVPAVNTLRHFSLAITPPKGRPPAMPLAKDTASGEMPYCWKANREPVRPTPVCTSSMSSSQSRFSHRSATAETKARSRGSTPPSPWISSNITAHTSCPATASTLSRSLASA